VQRALGRVGSAGETPASVALPLSFSLSLSLSLTLPSSCMPRATPHFLSSRAPFSLLVTLGYLLAGKNSANSSVACSR